MPHDPMNDRDPSIADSSWIQSEVDRLAPWYYAFTLGDVRTDQGDPCDHHGFRSVSLPPGAALYLDGRTILDAGCNEGGYSFAAIEAGAIRTTGFDCRDVNVEKARLVAKVNGYDNAEFHVGTTDSWIEKGASPADVVFLCGLLYHLPEPWKTIEQYCALAKERVYVTCVINGGDHGYREYYEGDIISANVSPEVISRMPNTSETIITEFAKHGFHPLHIGEGTEDHMFGYTWMLMNNCRSLAPFERIQRDDPEVLVYFVPESVEAAAGRARPFDLSVVMLSRCSVARDAIGHLTVYAGDKVHERVGPVPLHFDVTFPEADSSRSIDQLLKLDLPETNEPIRLEITLRDPGTEELFETAELRLQP